MGRWLSALFLSRLRFLLLLLFLLGLHCGEVDVPDEDDLKNDGDEDDEQNGEENGLIVEDGDGLRGRPNTAKPVELTHLKVRLEPSSVGECLEAGRVSSWDGNGALPARSVSLGSWKGRKDLLA